MKNKFFCILPWLHLYVHPTGEVRTCCIGNDALGSTKKRSLSKIWNSDKLKKLRLELLSGNAPSNCSLCVNSEYYTKDSMRIRLTNLFKNDIDRLTEQTNVDGSIDSFELQYLDVRFSNRCNFKCRTCSPESSSSIAAEKNKYLKNDLTHLIYPGKNQLDLDEQLIKHIPFLKKIYIAGGEPLVQQNHWRLLEKFIEYGRTDITIMYSTNLSVLEYKGKSILDYWKRFKNVEVNASLDGWKEPAEYWRKGTNWKQIVTNVEQIKSITPHVQLSMAPTVGWPNLWNVLDLIDHCIDTKFIDPTNMHINVLTVPKKYSLTSLPNFKKDFAVSRIRQTLDTINNSDIKYTQLESSLLGLIEYTRSSSTIETLKEFVKHTTILDSVRKEDFYKAFPEHLDMKQYLDENYKKTT